MCGISGIAGEGWSPKSLDEMVLSQSHRGPDATAVFVDSTGKIGLGHNRLSIIDLSEAGRQPMANRDGSVQVILNGELYNYLELRESLDGYPYRSQSDTEVILAAYERWGASCFDRFIGMFAVAIWDAREQCILAARDRFGVKPFYYAHLPGGAFAFSSEIKALHAAGVPGESDPVAWSGYLTYGMYDHSERTFWKGVSSLPAGHALRWKNGDLRIWKWYDLADDIANDTDTRRDAEVAEEYRSLLNDSVRLRFRSDVPVGINLSGGVDSSTLLGLVHSVKGAESDVKAFTFATGDERYDELPWVAQLLAGTRHPHEVCWLRAEEVPDLARLVQRHQDEPFGGLPTLAYSRLFKTARELGVIVFLDGQGLDEQWAGYEYYSKALNGASSNSGEAATGPVQGSTSSPTRPECLSPEFRDLAERFSPPKPFDDQLRNLQYRDACYSKIPRALRFNDRISMMYGTELREPFLDHRLFRLAFRQPADRKIRNGTHKWLLRQIARELAPSRVVEAPKRPLQTPQREWLKGPLCKWAEDTIEEAISRYGGVWLDPSAVRREW